MAAPVQLHSQQPAQDSHASSLTPIQGQSHKEASRALPTRTTSFASPTPYRTFDKVTSAMGMPATLSDKPAPQPHFEQSQQINLHRQQDLRGSAPDNLYVPTPGRSGKRKMGHERVARKPALPRKARGKKNFDGLTRHLVDEEANNLIAIRSGLQPPGAQPYQDIFPDKQAALSHLLRARATIEYYRLPQQMLVEETDLHPETRLTLQQLTLEASAQAPASDLAPAFLKSHEDRQSFVDNNHYQFDIVCKQLGDAQDSSACVCILIETILDLHSKVKGIPISDLDLTAQTQFDLNAGTFVAAKLTTKKGN
ncbi:hypothetical protein BST61_g11185 [Cercospora zeina]